MNTNSKHLDLLDYLRGIAILLVLYNHTFYVAYSRYDLFPGDGWLRSFPLLESFFYFIPNSLENAGVPVFFIVSGFCIHLSFQQQGGQWGAFFIRRAFRIYPAYFMALVLSISFEMHHFQFNWHNEVLGPQIWSHLFLVHNFSAATIFTLNPPFWTLAVEAQLYLLYPVLLWLVHRFGWKRGLMLLGGIEVIIRAAALARPPLPAAGAIADTISWTLLNSPLAFWFSWSLGAFVAEAYLKRQPLPFQKSRPLLWLAVVVAAYLVKPLTLFAFTAYAIITAMILSQLLQRTPKINGNKLLTGILKKTGLWSYSIYLLHMPLLYIFYYFAGLASPAPGDSRVAILLMMSGAYLLIIPASVIWYHAFELRGIALGKWIIRRFSAASRKPANNSVPSLPWLRHALMMVAALAVMAGLYFANAKCVPLDPEVTNNLAWALATDPDPAQRDGAKAVALAEDACKRAVGTETIMIGTLAAAYAEAGRFDDAIATAQKACDMATEKGETNLLRNNQELLKLYLKHEAYHSPMNSNSKLQP